MITDRKKGYSKKKKENQKEIQYKCTLWDPRKYLDPSKEKYHTYVPYVISKTLFNPSRFNKKKDN